MGFIIVYITHKDLKNAKQLCSQLLNKRLIACANYIPIESAYWWDNKIENDKEVVSIVKTIPDKWDLLKKTVKRLHPYKTPCIMKFDVEANKDYEDWIRKQTE